jgi:hypothetical protein
MSVFDQATERMRRVITRGEPGGAVGAPGARGPATPPPGAPASAVPPVPFPRAAPPGDGRSELHRRRDALAARVAEMHWDLGGLAYEMAIRDHFRLDVLIRRAALLQERDAELAEVERLLRMEESATAGSCPRCGAPHSRGAVYCWQCGTTLMDRAKSSAAPATRSLQDAASTAAAMEALLAPSSASEPKTAAGE